MALFQYVIMAFMTPIIKSGWNLYDVHPPIKIIHRRKLAAAKKTASSGNLQSILLHRRHTVNGSSNGSTSKVMSPATGRSMYGANRKVNQKHVKAFHANAVATGQYHLAAFSTDSLRMRNLDLAMQVIPEEVEDEQVDENCDPHSAPIIALTHKPDGDLKKSKGKHLLDRIRRMFGLISKPTDQDPTLAMTRKAPTLSRVGSLAAQRRRS